MKQLFLPLGLIVSVLLAITFPAGGVLIDENNGFRIIVFIIFLVSGYQTGGSGGGITPGRSLFTLLGTATIISLLLGPVLGLLVSKIFHLPLSLAIGLLIISSAPPTVSSGVVITETSGGNAVLALFLTIALNLLGIFTMPFILDLCLHAVGSTDIDQAALLVKMLLLVLFPFIIGKSIRNVRQKEHVSALWSYFNSSAVILIVYSSISSASGSFSMLKAGDYAQIFACSAIVHILLLLLNAQAGKALHLSSADSKALLFVNSQKTLSIALAVLATLRIDTGNAIVVCLIFHFLQLFIDSFLAAALIKKTSTSF